MAGHSGTEERPARKTCPEARLRELQPESSGTVLSTQDLEGVDVVADLGDADR
jgi:hypothetical protein